MSISPRQPLATKHLSRLARSGMTLQGVSARTGAPQALLLDIAHGDVAELTPALEVRILAISSTPPRPNGPVSALGARRRLQALAVMGWSTKAIGSLLGWPAPSLDLVLEAGTISRRRHELIAAAYDLLWNRQPSDSLDAAAVRAFARTRNWASPLAWDDIDRDAGPATVEARDRDEVSEELISRALDGYATDLNPREQTIAVARLKADCVADQLIASMLGISTATVTRRWREAREQGLHTPESTQPAEEAAAAAGPLPGPSEEFVHEAPTPLSATPTNEPEELHTFSEATTRDLAESTHAGTTLTPLRAPASKHFHRRAPSGPQEDYRPHLQADPRQLQPPIAWRRSRRKAQLSSQSRKPPAHARFGVSRATEPHDRASPFLLARSQRAEPRVELIAA